MVLYEEGDPLVGAPFLPNLLGPRLHRATAIPAVTTVALDVPTGRNPFSSIPHGGWFGANKAMAERFAQLVRGM
jgi:hypothetical protein